MKKLRSFNLQEMLIVLAIIGILLLIALPNLMPLIAKAKSVEAQTQLKAIHNAQSTYRYLHSTYGDDFNAIDFEAPPHILDGGTANYRYDIVESSSNGFKAVAEAVVDFDGDGDLNLWEIDEKGIPTQIIKD